MDMVERVARAIWDERCRHWGKYRKDLHEPDSEGYDWGDLGLSKRKELLREARAAIAAMREPTEEMGSAGLRKWTKPGNAHEMDDADFAAGNPCRWMKPVWRAMIDAALKSSGSGA